MDPGAVDALAARLPDGVVVISATNGKTTTTAMAAEILGEGRSLAWNRAGANLLSGIASALVAGRRAELGLFEVDEGALPETLERTKPRVVALGNLFRDQLDRYGELELVAERWRTAVANLPARDDARRERGRRRRSRTLPTAVPVRVRVRTRRSTPRARKAAARRRLEVLRELRRSLRVRGRVRGPSRRLPLPELRAPPAEARHLDPGDRAPRPARIALSARDSGRRDGRGARPARPLQRLQRAAAAALALAAGASLDDVRAGLERFSAAFGRFERIAVGGQPAARCSWSRTQPARTRPCARSSTGGAPPLPWSRSTTRSPTAGRVVDLGRRLRATARAGSTGDRHAATAPPSSALRLQVRRLRGRSASRSSRRSSARSTAGSS